MNLVKQLFQRRELLLILVQRNLKIRYKNSALGFLWSLLTPALMILMYACFAKILKFSDGADYLPFLVAGIVIWQFTAGCMNDSLQAIVGNTNLVKKVAFPRIILPLSTAFANGVNFLLTLIVLIVYLMLAGVFSYTNIYWLIPAVIMQLMLCIGICCICSVSNVFFRDTEHIIGIGSLAWFFLSPVFYRIPMQTSAVTGVLGLSEASQFQGIVFLNPMTGILGLYRAALMENQLPVPAGVSLWWLLASAGVCLALFIAGLIAIHKGDKSFGDVL